MFYCVDLLLPPPPPASLEDTLEALPQLLKKRQKALEEREQELERKIAAFDKESGHMSIQQAHGDVLHLNVGGTLTTVLRRTLISVEGSMLASRFSGRWDDSLEKDRDGHFFIDQPIELFLVSSIDVFLVVPLTKHTDLFRRVMCALVYCCAFAMFTKQYSYLRSLIHSTTSQWLTISEPRQVKHLWHLQSHHLSLKAKRKEGTS